MKVTVTGGTGMVGCALQRIMPKDFTSSYLSSKFADLRCADKVAQSLSPLKPDVVIHLAAKVGGIIANNANQYDFFYDNLMINTNVVNWCMKHKVKLIAISSTCVYPKKIEQYPITEDMLNLGDAEPTNAGYAYAKRAMKHQMEAAARQHSVEWALLYASNLYGPKDHFGRESAHVIPAILHRIHLAKLNNDPTVEIYGTGKPLRQFLYVDDLGKVILAALEQNLVGDYNVVNPPNISIREVAETIVDVVGYEGELEFNGKLDGIYKKDASVEKLKKSMDLPEFTSLRKGLELTYDWYLEHYDQASDI